MFVLKAQRRGAGAKAKQLRRAGMIPGRLYGAGIEESMPLQMTQSEVKRLLKEKAKGGRVTLDVEGEKSTALLREISCHPVSCQVEHLSFQKSNDDDTVTSTAQIILLNKEKIPGYIQQVLFDVQYKTLASNMVEKIEIDLEGMSTGDSIKVCDLDIAKNDDIEILTDLDSLVVSIIENRKGGGPAETEDETGAEQ